jgi:transposase
MTRIIEDLGADWRRLDERIEQLSSEIELLARGDAGCERLMSVPGIGPVISSAVFGWTVHWKAVTKRGVKLRTLAGLNFGMSREDLKAMCALLNTLREAAAGSQPK